MVGLLTLPSGELEELFRMLTGPMARTFRLLLTTFRGSDLNVVDGRSEGPLDNAKNMPAA